MTLLARNVSRAYGSSSWPRGRSHLAIDDVSLSIAPRDHVAIIGASGAGKSTLARLLVGLERPDRGSVQLDGRDVADLPPRERRVQLLFQHSAASLDPRQTIGAILEEALALAEAPGAKGEGLEPALRAVDLPVDVRARFPHQLSGGQQQRVALARVLAARPRVLVLDEPLSAADPILQARLLALLTRIREESDLAMVLITHDLRAVRAFADRVLVLDRGRTVAEGAVSDLLGPAAPPRLAEMLKKERLDPPAHGSE